MSDVSAVAEIVGVGATVGTRTSFIFVLLSLSSDCAMI